MCNTLDSPLPLKAKANKRLFLPILSPTSHPTSHIACPQYVFIELIKGPLDGASSCGFLGSHPNHLSRIKNMNLIPGRRFQTAKHVGIKSTEPTLCSPASLRGPTDCTCPAHGAPLTSLGISRMKSMKAAAEVRSRKLSRRGAL